MSEACAAARAAFWCAAFAAAGVAYGQESRTDSRPFAIEAPLAARPPVIDGVIGDDEWAGAAVVSEFTQVEPVEGAKPSERTEILILVDADAIYFALKCFDSAPEGVAGTQMTRDADLSPDDRVEIVLDTFQDRRNAYFFQTNPTGALGDALVVNNGAIFIKDWDGAWSSRSTVDDRGWFAEMAIPAKTLSMPAGRTAFGFNVMRHIKRKNEQLRWASPGRLRSLFQLGGAGDLYGVLSLDAGVGIDVVPHVSTKLRRDHATDEDDLLFDPGVDVRWRVTPSLAATFTVNTDFADTEVDDRVVNLTRFPVFFPEKRDFFLEDAGIFTFAGLRDTTAPFYSRRVGVAASGRPTGIEAGVKLTGRIGGLGVGLMDVLQEEADGVEARNLFVGRLTVDLFEESQLGTIFTYGDPRTNGDNGVVGLDYTFRTRDLFGDKNFRIDAFVVGSEDDPDRLASPGLTEAAGYDYGAVFNYPNDVWRGMLTYRETSEDFRPDLGFVGRRGERAVFGEFEYRPRVGGAIRRFEFGLEPDVRWSLEDGDVDSASVEIRPFGVEFESQDEAFVFVTPTHERLLSPFQIDDAALLPVGDYDFVRYGAEATSSDARRISGRLRLEHGSFYDGDSVGLEAALTVRFPPQLRVSLEYRRNDVTLPAGDFDTNLWRARVRYDVTPDVSFGVIAQYDDVSDSFGTQARFRWILEPGRDLSLVVSRNWSTEDPATNLGRFVPIESEIAAKLEYLIRF